MNAHDPRTCPDCQRALKDLKAWLKDTTETAEWFQEEFDMDVSEARIHIHLMELAHVLQPRVLMVSSSSGGPGGTWN